jgi:hypothetical protein
MSVSSAKQDAEVIPLRAASSVQAKKDGMVYTKVIIYASGNTIEFRMAHTEAQRLKDVVSGLILGTYAEAPPSPSPSPVVQQGVADELEQLKKLGELRDAGVLTNEEFEVKKRQILDGTTPTPASQPVQVGSPDPESSYQEPSPSPEAVFHDGHWWQKGTDGLDYWWDEASNEWKPWG